MGTGQSTSLRDPADDLPALWDKNNSVEDRWGQRTRWVKMTGAGSTGRSSFCAKYARHTFFTIGATKSIDYLAPSINSIGFWRWGEPSKSRNAPNLS